MKIDLAKLNPRLAHCRKVGCQRVRQGDRLEDSMKAYYSFSEQELSDLLNTVLALQKRHSPELVKQGLGEDLIDITLNE